MAMKDTDIAWAAGIIDGEGCISVHAHRTNGEVRFYSLLLKVTMGHQPTIERLHTLFATGTIQNVNQRRWNPAWSFYCSTRQAEAVIKTTYPYLVTKRDEADLALQFLSLDVTPGRRSTPEVRAAKTRLFVELRDIKPSARFRAARA